MNKLQSFSCLLALFAPLVFASGCHEERNALEGREPFDFSMTESLRSKVSVQENREFSLSDAVMMVYQNSDVLGMGYLVIWFPEEELIFSSRGKFQEEPGKEFPSEISKGFEVEDHRQRYLDFYEASLQSTIEDVQGFWFEDIDEEGSGSLSKNQTIELQTSLEKVKSQKDNGSNFKISGGSEAYLFADKEMYYTFLEISENSIQETLNFANILAYYAPTKIDNLGGYPRWAPVPFSESEAVQK